MYETRHKKQETSNTVRNKKQETRNNARYKKQQTRNNVTNNNNNNNKKHHTTNNNKPHRLPTTIKLQNAQQRALATNYHNIN
jgi:hypothetical protein